MSWFWFFFFEWGEWGVIHNHSNVLFSQTENSEIADFVLGDESNIAGKKNQVTEVFTKIVFSFIFPSFWVFTAKYVHNT